MTSRLYDSIEPNVIDEEMLQKAVEEQGPQEEAGQLAKKEGINFKEVSLVVSDILKIDNLSQFVSLTKLQLDNNIIEKIEALDSLIHLVWLVIWIPVPLLQMIYLRKFKNLRTLNLTGNPVCDNELYAMFIAAYLPDLVYLDFRLVDDNMREMAFMKYQYAIEEMKAGEYVALAKQQSAYVEYLNGPFLFDSMYADDPEAANYLLDTSFTYKSKFVAICEALFEYGLREHEKREAEVTLFYECLNEALADNEAQGTKIIQDFEKKNGGALDVIQNLSDSQITETKLAEYSENLSKLSETLMSLEMQLVDQLECRDLENHHHEKLLEIAINTLEKLFVDKDTIVNAVNASHDIHLLKIDNREDEIITKANGWASVIIEKVHHDELNRNRSRVMEINQYVDHLRSELDSWDIMEQ
ncbi:hypothetical protein JD844_020059 [Phrynosoma platyrhinos]|uniref:Dynein regulatory complex subunit 3 n=1 Tax=Phrynosoma platyrhinos TaxID=52577 RepID=A0ABQ7TQF4_PHRPL|nr:hypothetical protein JD844_020059 [Phrynosoma platyrhinos]